MCITIPKLPEKSKERERSSPAMKKDHLLVTHFASESGHHKEGEQKVELIRG